MSRRVGLYSKIMTDIAFYHLEHARLEDALPKLLEKTLQAGKRGFVLARSEDRVEALTQSLWTYDPASWLPHGSAKDPAPEDQPIFLSAEEENQNKATFLFLTDGAEAQWVDAYERAFELFDGHDPGAVEAARARWKRYKAEGHDLTYWQQDMNGRWHKKA